MAESVKYAIELIDEVSAKLKKIHGGLNKTDAEFSKTGKNAKGFGSSLSGISPSLIKGASLIGGIGIALVGVKKAFDFTTKAIFNFSGASAKLKAIVQPTTEQFKSLEKAALELGSTTAFTASQVMEAFTEQAKLGQEVNEILASGNSILNLAAMAQINLSEAAEMTVQTLNQFDMTADETNRVVDVMAKSFTSSALDARKFAEAMKYAGTIGAESGDSIEDVTAVLGILADRSIDASQAGTATRRVMLELADANSKASKAIKATGKDADTFTQKLQVLKGLNLTLSDTTDLFGVLSATAATVMVKSADSVDELSLSLQGANGSAEQMAETMLNSLPGASIKMQSALEGLALTFKDKLTPAFTVMIKGITKLAQVTTKLLEGQKDLKGLRLGKLYEEQNKQLEKLNNLQKQNLDINEDVQEMAEGHTQYLITGTNHILKNKDKDIAKTKKQLSLIQEQIRAEEKLNTGRGFDLSLAATLPVPSTSTTTTVNKVVSIADTSKQIEAQKKLSSEIQKIQEQTALMKVSGQEKELLALDQWYSSQAEKFTGHKDMLSIVDASYQERKELIEEEALQKTLQKEDELFEKKKTLRDIDLAQVILAEEEKAKKKKEVAQISVTTAAQSGQIISNALFTIGKQRSNREKKQQIERVKNSTKSEAEKVKAIEAIEKAEFEKNKRRSIAQALINGALGAVKTIANMGMPAAIPMLILQGVMTAANIAVIASQKFAKGGIVQQESGKSSFGDQHLIRANPGEMVLTKEQQKNIGPTVNIGGTSITIQGNVTQDTIDQIDNTLQDRNEEIRSTLLELSESGRISGVTF